MPHSVVFSHNLKCISVFTFCQSTRLFSIKNTTRNYMSAHVLLNLLNELGKRYKIRGLSSILSFFRNEYNKFNNTKARLLDSFYHMTLRLL